MTKKKAGISRKDASKALIQTVNAVVAEVQDKHVFSVSRIYGAHNEVFGLRETPQTCGSCLKTRAKALAEWLGKREPVKEQTQSAADVGAKDAQGNPAADKFVPTAEHYLDPTIEGHVPPAEGVTRYPMGKELPLDFTPSKDNALKGTIKNADGSGVKPGTYTTASGQTIAVQVGGKATIKEDDLT